MTFLKKVCLLENAVLLVLWTIATSDNPSTLRLFLAIGQPIFFASGVCPLIYYLKKIETKKQKNEQPAHFGSAQLSISINYKDILVTSVTITLISDGVLIITI